MAVKFSDGGKGFLGRAPRPTPEQMQARQKNAAAIKAAQLRKQQTRQKIVLGVALVAMAEAGDPEAQRLRDRIMASLTRDADRKAFGL